MTLSFQPLSLAEVARRRAARTLAFHAATAPEVESPFEVVELLVPTEEDEVR